MSRNSVIYAVSIGVLAFCLTFLSFELVKTTFVPQQSEDVVEIVDVGDVSKSDLVACLREKGGDADRVEKKLNLDDVHYRAQKAEEADQAYTKGIALGTVIGIGGSILVSALIGNLESSDD